MNATGKDPNRPRDQDRKDGKDVTAPATEHRSSRGDRKPTAQLGGRIDWELDQQFRNFVDSHPGTLRKHLENALREYLARHSDE